MGLDSALRGAAKAVVYAVGAVVKVRQVTVGAYNASTHTATTTTADTTTRGRLDEYVAHELSDTVLVGDRKLTIAASSLTFVPKPDDKVIIGSAVYDVISVESIMAQDLAALFVLQLRGAA